jgi:hypothetical protein
MRHPDQFNIVILDTPPVPTPPMRSACLVPGCACKDARIVSHRRAAFFAAMARGTGETADRMEPVDPSWAFTWVLPEPLDAAASDLYLDEAVAA